MRTAVIGAGAMGGLFAARLAKTGRDVSLVEIAGSHIDAIRTAGLRVTDEGREEEIHWLSIGPAEDFTGEFDLLVVFTKGMHTKAAMASVRHLVGEHTWALTVQNGVGNVEAIGTVVPQDRIIMGMTNWPSAVIAPGHVTISGKGEVRIWAASGGSSQRLTDICDLLNDAELNCALDPLVEVAIWEKLAFNAALNSLAAVTGMTVGEMADRSEAREMAFAIVGEALAVARARGLEVSTERTHLAVEHALKHHRAHKPSMLQDRIAGRPMEVDTITGAVSKEGQRLGVTTPVTTTFYNLLRLASVA